MYKKKQELLRDPTVKQFVKIPNLPNKSLSTMMDELIFQDTYLDTPPLFRTLMASKEKIEQSMKVLQDFNKIFQPLMNSKFVKGFEQIIKIEDEKAKEIVEKNSECLKTKLKFKMISMFFLIIRNHIFQ